MNRKPKLSKIEEWYFVNKENINGFVKVFIPLVILVIFIRNIPNLTRGYFMYKLDSRTIGILDTIIYKKGIHESEAGGKVYNKTYELHYSFYNEGINYSTIERVERRTLTIEELAKINTIKIKDSIVISFESENPQNCMIKLK